MTDLWEEVRGERPLPPPPKPKPPAPKPGRAKRSPRPTAQSQWLFATVETEDGLSVVFTPIEYWEREGAAYDQELPEDIKRVLPHYLEEVMESTCVTNIHEDHVRIDLLTLGFRQDAGFTEWVRGAAAINDDS